MLPYEKKILDKLLKKYERSKTSKEGSTRNLSISLIFNEKNIPEYVNDSSYLFETEIEEAVISLKNKNYVKKYNCKSKFQLVIWWNLKIDLSLLKKVQIFRLKSGLL